MRPDGAQSRFTGTAIGPASDARDYAPLLRFILLNCILIFFVLVLWNFGLIQTMLVTDHNVQRTLEIVDRAYVIFEGKVFAEGTPREIINNEQVRKLYLGSTFRGDEFG